MRRMPLAFLKLVHAHDDRRSPLDGLLIRIRRILDLALNESLLDRRKRAAQRIDLIDIFASPALDVVGQSFDVIAAAQRVRLLRDAALVSDHLLGSQSQPSGFLRRQA